MVTGSICTKRVPTQRALFAVVNLKPHLNYCLYLFFSLSQNRNRLLSVLRLIISFGGKRTIRQKDYRLKKILIICISEISMI